MKLKKAGFLFLLILVVAALFISRWKDLQQQGDKEKALRERSFDRRISKLEYTKHALCRMDCRQISKNDINDIMNSGEVNYAKTDVNDKPCPTYALQGHTTDGQYLRVIFAQCDTKTKVVTCYDLEKDFECHCPGDEKKKRK